MEVTLTLNEEHSPTPSSLRRTAAPLLEKIEAAIQVLLSKLRHETHAEGDMAQIHAIADAIEQLKAARAAIEDNVEDAIAALVTVGAKDDVAYVSTKGLRTIVVEVTEGMIRQNLLTLTPARKKGQVRLGEKFSITLSDGKSFETDLCNPGNRLRERSIIRWFYETEKVKAGEEVALLEVERGKWKLLRGDHPEAAGFIPKSVSASIEFDSTHHQSPVRPLPLP